MVSDGFHTRDRVLPASSRKRSRLAALLGCLALVGAACEGGTTASTQRPSSDAVAGTAAPATTAPSTTVAPTTTEPPATEGTTTAFRPPPPPAESDPLPTPWGSGCAPPGDTLPDGDWFGFLEGIELGAESRIDVDLACYFDGDHAEPAAVEDAYPHLPLEFAPYVRNQVAKVFEIPVSAAAMVEDFMLEEAVDFTQWISTVSAERGCSASTDFAACPIWMRIDQGEAVLLYGILMEWAGDDRGS